MKMIRKMIKSSLIKKLLKNNPHLVQKDVENIVNIVLDGISNALSKKGRAEIRGFGTFSLRKKNKRIGRNPKTEEKVTVPARIVPTFKFSRAFKDEVDDANNK